MRKGDREKLYDSKDSRNHVSVKVPFDPLLLSVLGYFNPLKPEDKPDLAKVEEVRAALSGFGIRV